MIPVVLTISDANVEDPVTSRSSISAVPAGTDDWFQYITRGAENLSRSKTACATTMKDADVVEWDPPNRTTASAAVTGPADPDSHVGSGYVVDIAYCLAFPAPTTCREASALGPAPGSSTVMLYVPAGNARGSLSPYSVDVGPVIDTMK